MMTLLGGQSSSPSSPFQSTLVPSTPLVAYGLQLKNGKERETKIGLHAALTGSLECNGVSMLSVNHNPPWTSNSPHEKKSKGLRLFHNKVFKNFEAVSETICPKEECDDNINKLNTSSSESAQGKISVGKWTVVNNMADEFDAEILYVEYLENIGDAQHVNNFRNDDFENISDAKFYERYRLKKEVVRMIVQETEDRLEYTTDRNHPLTPLQQILLALRFYATGSFEIVIGDMNGVSKATVSRYVKKVSDVLATWRPRYINFPIGDEVETVISDFYNIAQFPGVIGTIDCTHVPILSPGATAVLHNIAINTGHENPPNDIALEYIKNRRIDVQQYGDVEMPAVVQGHGIGAYATRNAIINNHFAHLTTDEIIAILEDNDSVIDANIYISSPENHEMSDGHSGDEDCEIVTDTACILARSDSWKQTLRADALLLPCPHKKLTRDVTSGERDGPAIGQFLAISCTG
ncbi:hypothetical protein C0J52_27078 [Blattella germanica]|nr:hypothetical protein C0J52_27078 [Blattella germanica]